MKNNAPFQQGIDALNNNQMYQAENLFLQVAPKDEKYIASQFGLMLAYGMIGKQASLVKIALKLANTDIIDSAVVPKLLSALHHTGNGKLFTAFSNTLNQYGENIGVLYQCSLCLRQVGQPAIALKYLEKIGKKQNEKCIFQILDALFELYPTENLQFYIYTLGQCCGFSLEENWIQYQIIRYRPDVIDIEAFDAIPTTPITARKITYNSVNTMNSCQLITEPTTKLQKAPPLTHEQFSKNLIKFKAMAADAIKQPPVIKQLHLLKQVAEKYLSPLKKPPIQVISTGRAGTTSLYDLLDSSDSYIPFHSFSLQSSVRERIELFTRIRADKFDQGDVNRFTEQYLKIRISEFIYAARLGKTPVIVSHWDSIFCGINAAIFDNLKILYISRNAKSSANSFINKLQWQYGQLLDVDYAIQEDNPQFIFTIDEEGDIAQQIGWYLYATKVLAAGAETLVGEENYLALSADDLFNKNESTYQSLCDFLSDENLSIAKIENQYSTPTNQKDDRLENQTDWSRKKIGEVEIWLDKFNHES